MIISMKKHRLILVLLIGIVSILACSIGRIQTRNYYILSYTPVSKVPVTSKRPYPYSLQIGRFEVQRIFNRQNILYRYSPNQIQYYELQQWAVRPDYMVTDVVFKHLEISSLTNRVGIDFFETRPDFRIEGTVEALEKLDSGDIYFAHLAMTFKMLNVKNGEQVWEYSFDQRRQVFQDEMVYTIRGLSSILQAQMDVIVNQLDSLFLAMTTGLPQEIVNSAEPSEKPTKTESISEDLDESAFEIIPEKKEEQEEK